MPDKAIYLLVVDGFADWEPAHAVAELRRHGRYRVESVGLTPAPVHSMGGLRVLLSTTVSEVDPADVAAFILPGGDRWESAPVEPELEELLNSLDEKGVPIAAICGATVAIARIGLVRGRRHTSNGLAYLRSQVPGYAEAANYLDAPVVRDRGLITASGLGDVEFARELFEELNVLSPEDRAAQRQVHREVRSALDSRRETELLRRHDHPLADLAVADHVLLDRLRVVVIRIAPQHVARVLEAADVVGREDAGPGRVEARPDQLTVVRGGADEGVRRDLPSPVSRDTALMRAILSGEIRRSCWRNINGCMSSGAIER